MGVTDCIQDLHRYVSIQTYIWEGLSVELQNKAMWAMKRVKMHWNESVEQRLNGLNDLDDFLLKAYECLAIYKDKMKKYHD